MAHAAAAPAAASCWCLTNCRRIGGEAGVVLELHRACKRCSVTSYNPDTAIQDPEAKTLVTLKTHRAAHAGPGETVGLFGQYAIHMNNGHIAVNQDIEVLEYKRQNDVKHTLVHPNIFVPHHLRSAFQSFRVLSNSCDDPRNTRPMHRIKLEVGWYRTQTFSTRRCPPCTTGRYCGGCVARGLACSGGRIAHVHVSFFAHVEVAPFVGQPRIHRVTPMSAARVHWWQVGDSELHSHLLRCRNLCHIFSCVLRSRRDHVSLLAEPAARRLDRDEGARWLHAAQTSNHRAGPRRICRRQHKSTLRFFEFICKVFLVILLKFLFRHSRTWCF
jgi:hypothetical protein